MQETAPLQQVLKDLLRLTDVIERHPQSATLNSIDVPIFVHNLRRKVAAMLHELDRAA